MIGRKAILAGALIVAVVGIGLMTASTVAQETGDQAEIELDKLEVEFVVSEEGEYEQFAYRYLLSGEAYGELQTIAEQDGYESVTEMFTETFEMMMGAQYGEQGTLEQETVEMNEVDGMHEIEIVYGASGLPSDELTVADGTVTAEVNAGPTQDDTINENVLIIDMPDEVVDSNADEVDGSTAMWHLHDNPPATQFVESASESTGSTDEATDDEGAGDEATDDETQAEDGADDDEAGDEANDEADDDDDGLPGFGLTAAIVGALGAVLVLGYRRP